MRSGRLPDCPAWPYFGPGDTNVFARPTRRTKAISIKGPDGVLEVVNVANPETLDQVQVGEHIVVTLTDAVAITLDKEAVASSNEAQHA
jgi:hypothetical protein